MRNMWENSWLYGTMKNNDRFEVAGGKLHEYDW